MSQLTALLVVIFGGLLIATITATIVKKSGYSFWHYFVTGFLMGAGILGIIMKILLNYL